MGFECIEGDGIAEYHTEWFDQEIERIVQQYEQSKEAN